MLLPRLISILDPAFPNVESCDDPAIGVQSLSMVDVQKARGERARKNREGDVERLREIREAKVISDLTEAVRNALDHYGNGADVTRAVESILRKQARRARRRLET